MPDRGDLLRILEPAARFILQGGTAARAAAGQAFGVALPDIACRSNSNGERSALWLGPDECLVLAPDGTAHRVAAELEIALSGLAHSLVDVSDRQVGWEQNYRCPDVAVVLPDSSAVDCGAFYFGGPDFLVEVASDYDRSREKFDFYASVGVREFLIVDRAPWQLELYALLSDGWKLTGTATASNGLLLASSVLPLTFQLVAPASPGRPQIVVATPHGERRWFA